jgi:anti-anti-sigma factor
MTATGGFSASVTTAGEVALVTLAGEADLAARPEFSAALDDALATDAPTVVLDVARLSYLESACLRTVLHAYRTADEQGRHLVMRNVRGIVRRVLDVAGVTAVLVEHGNGGGD